MDKRTREIYDDSILNKALSKYGVAKENVQLLDGFESFIYEYDKSGKGYVLRISHSLHRTPDLIQGEIEWINYLADNGVPAARAVTSEHGNLVEPISAKDGSHFTATSFERARGTYSTKVDWNNGLAVQLGQIVGRMHALTKHFEPSDARFRRHEWHKVFSDGFAEQYLPASETKVITKFNELLEYLYALPKDKDSYGLIHSDVHGGNFYMDEGKVTLFDFDDCQYAWFIYDIAMALFYAISHNCVSKEDITWAHSFFGQFMEGYRREHTIDPEWLRQIPYFLKLREIDLYIIIHRSFDLDDLDPWCTSFMDNRRYKIENNVPYVELDWDNYT
ncbi:MAG: phosphotransferase [Chloroflexi bacterium]|nr:phosphotransferase [Chloroflexota bacterium]